MDYLALARLGKNDWWRYCLAILVILTAWQMIGAIPSIFLITWTIMDGDPKTLVMKDGRFEGIDINISFTAMMLASIAFLGGIFLAIRLIHQRKLITLITTSPKVSWKRIFLGFSSWFFICAIMAILESYLYPGRYEFSFNGQYFFPFLFLALFFIPIQTTTEELFFRGYIIQGLGLKIKSSIVLSNLSGIIFMLPHLLNPEAEVNYLMMGSSYYAIGVTLAFITIKTGTLELALGMHAANNLFTALFANAIITVMPTPSLFSINQLDATYSMITTIIACVIFILLFSLPKRKPT